MSKYNVMMGDDAVRYLTARDNGEEPSPDDFQRTVGSGDVIDLAVFTKLGDELRKLKKSFPAKLRERDKEGGRFEQRACVIVHQGLANCDRAALHDLDFWTWLAVMQFADIVEWRFGATGRHAKAANYGIGQRAENLFFRLWLRAELVKDSNDRDPYHLARTGDQDLWRSHILRQGYANARAVAKALLRLQAGQLKAKKLTVEGVRELAKRLRRLHANVVFEFLTSAQAEGLVLELSNDLKKGK
ncbi:MAG: DUF6339 family protein [Burkholderiales bacterium]